jgi:G3E family GTPase
LLPYGRQAQSWALAGVILDSIVTVVDAKHIVRQLSSRRSETSASRATFSTAPAQERLVADAAASSGSALASQQDGMPHENVSQDGKQATANTSKSAEALRVNEAQQQVAYADIMLLNKTDLVSAEELDKIERTVQRHNATVKVCPAGNARPKHETQIQDSGMRHCCASRTAVLLQCSTTCAQAQH